MATINGDVNIGDPNNYGVGYIATPFTLSGDFVTGRIADGDTQLPEWDLSALLEDITPITDIGPYTLTAAGLTGEVGVGSAVWPLLDGGAVLLNGGVGMASITLPMYAASGDVGTAGDIRPSAFTLEASGLAGQVGSGELTLDILALSGTALQHGLGNGDLMLTAPSVTATGFGGNVSSGVLVLSAPMLDASAVLTSAMSGALALPLYQLDADGFASAVGTANVILPGFSLSGQSASLAAPVFTSLVMNTRTKAVTGYDNSPFNSLCSFGGVILAASSAGIVALTGNTDNGAAISASLTTGISDFDSAQLKRVVAGYAGYRSTGDLQLTMITDDATEYTYTLSTRQAAALHPTRVVFGRGVRSRYWQWRLANVAGADFKLDDLAFDHDPQTRRV